MPTIRRRPGPQERVALVSEVLKSARRIVVKVGSSLVTNEGRGVDAAIDYVGHAQTFQVAYDSLTTSGRAVVIGVGKGDIHIPTRPLMLTERIVTGSRHSTRTELIETMEVMARGLIQPVIGMRKHFTEVESIFDAIVDEKLLGRGALTYE